MKYYMDFFNFCVKCRKLAEIVPIFRPIIVEHKYKKVYAYAILTY